MKKCQFLEELREQFKDSQSKIVFCNRESLSTVLRAARDLPELRKVIVVDGPENQRLPSGVIHLNLILKNKVNGIKFYPNIDIRKDLVSLPYSSGTTGRPKGVMLTHYSFGNLLKIVRQSVLEYKKRLLV